jgi:hypothetical protein
MSVLNQIAHALGRRDEKPNQALAVLLAKKKDKKGIKEIVDNLKNKDKNIQSDCIKVLDELGQIDPSLVSDYVKDLVALLDDKNNRMQWGAMAALDPVTLYNPKLIYQNLGKIVSAADKGSVITKDRCVNILIKLCGTKEYSKNAFPLLFEQLMKSFPNQFPMYAENALPVMSSESHKKKFLEIISSRMNDIERESGRKRLEKVIKKATRQSN